MVDDNSQAREVLEKAIAMELDGKEFFEGASNRMTRKRSKDMFLSLVTQETRHVEVLSNELRMLEEGRGWVALEEAKRIRGRPPRHSVFKGKTAKALEMNPDAGELEVIDVGIEVEKKSIEYYRTAGQESKDSKAKQVFNWLVGEESGHLTLLQAERDSRSGSGFHYDGMEFSLETQ